MHRFLRLLLAAGLLIGAVPQGRSRSFAPALESYLAWLASTSPDLYEGFAREGEWGRVFCGVRTEERRPSSALFPTTSAAFPVPALISGETIRYSSDGEGLLLSGDAPLFPGPVFDVLTPPPRFSLPL